MGAGAARPLSRDADAGADHRVPFIDRVAYKHSLKEIPLEVPSQICITRDNTQLQVDGVLYFQVTDPMKRELRVEQLHRRDHAVVADHAAQVIGKLELDKTFEERDVINAASWWRSTRLRSTGA
jgi:regulator of protease activity HflC (stomatin/prohibitin superfamily)